MATWATSIAEKLIITTQNGITKVRISPAGNLKSKEIQIPLETLKEMVAAQ